MREMDFPIGFRFNPSDGDLILHYLDNKLFDRPLPAAGYHIIRDIDVYHRDPHDLPICGLSFSNDKEEYYFTTAKSMSVTYGKRDTIEYTESGYWKQIRDEKGVSLNDNINSNGHIGMKKDFIFCWGKPPSGIQTKWILSEYRLLPSGFPHQTFDAALLAKIDTSAICKLRMRRYNYGPNSQNEESTVYLPKHMW